mmetsp:Transcript_80457/g.236659  ORF Transcript_80457/g.236659 Transcript_80457/m.236659 type:complete len:312 (-) Transcript_80457:102-1037(-)
MGHVRFQQADWAHVVRPIDICDAPAGIEHLHRCGRIMFTPKLNGPESPRVHGLLISCGEPCAVFEPPPWDTSRMVGPPSLFQGHRPILEVGDRRPVVGERLGVAAAEGEPLVVLRQRQGRAINGGFGPLVSGSDADVRRCPRGLVPVDVREGLDWQRGVAQQDELLRDAGRGQVARLSQRQPDHVREGVDEVCTARRVHLGHQPDPQQLHHVVVLAGVVICAVRPGHVGALQGLGEELAPDAGVLKLVLELEHEVEDTWAQHAPRGWEVDPRILRGSEARADLRLAVDAQPCRSMQQQQPGGGSEAHHGRW